MALEGKVLIRDSVFGDCGDGVLEYLRGAGGGGEGRDMDWCGEDFEGAGEVHGVELGVDVVEDFDGAR